MIRHFFLSIGRNTNYGWKIILISTRDSQLCHFQTFTLRSLTVFSLQWSGAFYHFQIDIKDKMQFCELKIIKLIYVKSFEVIAYSCYIWEGREHNTTHHFTTRLHFILRIPCSQHSTFKMFNKFRYVEHIWHVFENTDIFNRNSKKIYNIYRKSSFPIMVLSLQTEDRYYHNIFYTYVLHLINYNQNILSNKHLGKLMCIKPPFCK